MEGKANKKKKPALSPEEKKKAFQQLLIFGGVALLLFLIDIISKWIVQNTVLPGEEGRIEVIPNFFYITLSYNTGAAFSLGASWGVTGRILGIIISLVMSFLIIFYWIRHNDEFHTFERVIAALMSAGAVGNLIDRAFYWPSITGFNGVIDFLQFYLGGGPEAKVNMFNPFATFNVADACLVVGILLLLVYLILQLIRDSKKDSLREDPRLKKNEESSPARIDIVKKEENNEGSAGISEDNKE